MKPFSVDNIITGNGIGISLTGMAIVFTGLLLISIIIALLPRILAFVDSMTGEKKKEEVVSMSQIRHPMREGDELIAAIAMVLHAEIQRLSGEDTQRITIDRSLKQRSMWAASGNMKTFSRR